MCKRHRKCVGVHIAVTNVYTSQEVVYCVVRQEAEEAAIDIPFGKNASAY